MISIWTYPQAFTSVMENLNEAGQVYHNSGSPLLSTNVEDYRASPDTLLVLAS